MRWVSSLRRPFAALIAVWFALIMVEPAALHSCPVHAAHASPSVSLADEHAGHGGAMASHGNAADASQSTGHHDDHAACTCPGRCTASTVGVALPGAVVGSTVALTIATIDEPVATATFTPVRAPFVLPFPNGPPALSRVA